jgi:hypothetical protein
MPGGSMTPGAPAPGASPARPLPPLPSSPTESAPPRGGSTAPNAAPVSGASSDGLVGEGFTPFQLSYLAISGGLEEEGIPGGEKFLSAFRQGDISAEDVVEAGAASNRLGSAASDQADYTAGVDRFLEILRRDAYSH